MGWGVVTTASLAAALTLGASFAAAEQPGAPGAEQAAPAARATADPASEAADAAREQQAGAIYDLMHLPEMMRIMGREGQAMGLQLGRDYFPGEVPEGYRSILDRLYAAARIDHVMRDSFVATMAEMPEQDLQDLIAFFEQAQGQRVIEAELLARTDYLEQDVVADAAIAAAQTETRDPELFSLVEAYVEANDLVEMNVSASLTTDYHFFLGLVEGGAYPMDEAEIVEEVWQQEDEVRAETRDWLMGFLIHAYCDLDRADLRAYVALSETGAGQSLNAALFSSFAVVYDDIYRALGNSISTFLMGEEI